MLMIACSGMASVLAIPYGYPKVNTKVIPPQATINLFINWLLGLTLTPGLTRPLHQFTGPLWILLGHYVSAIMD